MLAFLTGRVLQAIPVLFGVSLAVFLMVHLIPGDPAALIAGTDATRADVENVRQSLGLDRPLPAQYVELRRQGADRRFRQVVPHRTAGAGRDRAALSQHRGARRDRACRSRC